MRRTSTLHAAAAALGLLAGFAMTPAERATLEGEVTPHAVSLAWDAPPPAVLPGAGPEEEDERGARARPPEPAMDAVRARPPAGRPAPAPRAQPAPRPRQEKRRAPRPLVLRQMDFAAFQAPRRDCPLAARRAAMRAAHAEEAALHAAMREAFAETHAAHAQAAARAEIRAAHAAHAAATAKS
ncbi:MAG TPA: hypothetical protein VF142_24285 [Longimicrobium sp.]